MKRLLPVTVLTVGLLTSIDYRPTHAQVGGGCDLPPGSPVVKGGTQVEINYITNDNGKNDPCVQKVAVKVYSHYVEDKDGNKADLYKVKWIGVLAIPTKGLGAGKARLMNVGWEEDGLFLGQGQDWNDQFIGDGKMYYSYFHNLPNSTHYTYYVGVVLVPTETDPPCGDPLLACYLTDESEGMATVGTQPANPPAVPVAFGLEWGANSPRPSLDGEAGGEVNFTHPSAPTTVPMTVTYYTHVIAINQSTGEATLRMEGGQVPLEGPIGMWSVPDLPTGGYDLFCWCSRSFPSGDNTFYYPLEGPGEVLLGNVLVP